MRILISGNSQASCLKTALDSSEANYPNVRKADWIVVPGGGGPYLSIKDDLIKIDIVDPRFPPRYVPDQSVLLKSVKEYDVVVISALGYIDGGFRYANPISTRTDIAPAGLPTRNQMNVPAVVSRKCFYEIASVKFRDGMIGFRFLRQLRAIFPGPIIVQPFPLLSAEIINRDDWHLARIYKDPLSANKYMLGIKDDYLSRACAELDCTLLSYPDPGWRKNGFTPKEYMNDHDCLHPTGLYGALVLSQIEDQVRYL